MPVCAKTNGYKMSTKRKVTDDDWYTKCANSI